MIHRGWGNIYSSEPDRRHYKVFSKANIGKLQIKNRLIRAATLERSGSEGNPTDTYLKMYKSLEAGGFGLILTGAFAAVWPDPELEGQIYEQEG